MSISHDAVADQVTHISRIVRGFDGCAVVPLRTTNKRMIIMCSGRNMANTMLANLKYNGYSLVDSAAGIQSSNYYVEVRFNYPY